MERFSQRESILLGYIPQRSLANDHSSPKARQGNSEVDFNDVFGGPPRRSSIHETRCSYIEATDDCAFRRGDGTVASRNSWTGMSEKPVFGEEDFNRKHFTRANFFDDIFKINDSLSSTMKRGWDRCSSSSGSRVLSPARPLPPNADHPFATSLPAQFSLPAKLTKGAELPTFGSAPRSPYKSKDGASNGISYKSSPHSRSSSINHGREERNENRSSHRQSILSQEFSLSSKESSNLTRYAETDTASDSKKESNCSEILTGGHQFHFSIYKWASNGVPLVMPLRGGSSLRSRKNNNTDKCSSSDVRIANESKFPTETLHDNKLPSNGVLANAKSFAMKNDKQNISTPPDTSTQGSIEMQQRVDPGDITPQDTGEKEKSHCKSEIGLHNKLKKISMVSEEAHKPELKPLCSLLYDNDYEQSNEEITKKATDRERTAKSTKKASVIPDSSKVVKKQDVKRSTLDHAEIGKGGLQGSPMNSRELGKIGGKGKVKDFVNIFNQEGLSKSKVSVDPQSQSSRWRKIGNSKAEKEEKEANFSKIRIDEKIHKSSGHEEKSPDALIMVNGCSEKQQSPKKNTNCMSNGTSGEKESSSTEYVGNGSKTVVGDTHESTQENFLLKELTQDENKLPNAGNDSEDIQDIDAKIQKWYHGKEGNIRSMLSNLQHVLWPESGWKPVPLVDIIEGNAVKRSYQKALLCLHPDKLQQKGATSQQKYIAEKVFDILQDAWTHFNSLGSL